MQRWSDDNLRSLNVQIEYVLRDTLLKSGCVKLVQKVTTHVAHAEDDTSKNYERPLENKTIDYNQNTYFSGSVKGQLHEN